MLEVGGQPRAVPPAERTCFPKLRLAPARTAVAAAAARFDVEL